jgi:hypothetical protein
MKFKSRLDRLEAMRPIAPWVPPIFFHSVVEPSENGPKEVGAFAKIYVEGNDLTIWRIASETNEDFELRVLKLKD